MSGGEWWESGAEAHTRKIDPKLKPAKYKYLTHTYWLHHAFYPYFTFSSCCKRRSTLSFSTWKYPSSDALTGRTYFYSQRPNKTINKNPNPSPWLPANPYCIIAPVCIHCPLPTFLVSSCESLRLIYRLLSTNYLGRPKIWDYLSHASLSDLPANRLSNWNKEHLKLVHVPSPKFILLILW